jgi:integrase
MAGHIKKRTLKDGSASYQARLPSPANRRKDVVKTFKLKKDAERWLAEEATAIHSGTHIDPRRSDAPFAVVADAWRETWEARGLEPRTRAGYEAILTRWLLGPADPLHPVRQCRFARAKVGAITPEMVQEFVNELSGARAPNTVRRVYGVLLQVLALAVQRRFIAANPCSTVRLAKPRAKAKRMLFLTPAEVAALADAVPASYRLPVLLAAYCGLRAGELWALRRRDVDLLHGTVTVERALKDVNGAALPEHAKGLMFGPTKTHATRKLTIPSPLVPLLEAHLSAPTPGGTAGPDALLFPSPTGKPVRHNEFYRRAYRPAVKALWPEGHRLHRLRWHDLRHTCAALSLAVTPSLHIVKERLGHDDIRTTINIYGHLLPSVDAALAAGLGALFESAAADNVVPLRPAAEQ